MDELENTLTELSLNTPEWVQYIRNVQVRWPHERMVGLVLTESADAYDVCFGWESCESYAMDGMLVIALQGDAQFGKTELQRLCNRARHEYIDCFGQ